MWPFRRVPRASPKRVAELETELGDVVIKLKWLEKQLIDLNARLATVQRQQKRAEVAPEPTIVEEPEPQYPPQFQPRPVDSTAHLSRRFRVP